MKELLMIQTLNIYRNYVKQPVSFKSNKNENKTVVKGKNAKSATEQYPKFPFSV